MVVAAGAAGRWRCSACRREWEGDLPPGKATLDAGIRRGYDGGCGRDVYWRLVPDAAPQAPVRHSDPATSHAAARSVNVSAGRADVLRCLRGAATGYTDEELYHVLSEAGVQISPSGARTRRSELAEAGLVVDSGSKRKTTTGRWAVVWRAVQ